MTVDTTFLHHLNDEITVEIARLEAVVEPPPPVDVLTIVPTTANPGDTVTLTGPVGSFGATSGEVATSYWHGVVVSWTDTKVVFTLALAVPAGGHNIYINDVWHGQSIQVGTVVVVDPPPPQEDVTITSIVPLIGDPTGTVTISGTHFGTQPGTVFIMDSVGHIVSWTDTLITFRPTDTGAAYSGRIAITPVGKAAVVSTQVYSVIVASSGGTGGTEVPGEIKVPYQEPEIALADRVTFRTVDGISLTINEPIPLPENKVIFQWNDPFYRHPYHSYFGNAITDAQMMMPAGMKRFSGTSKGLKNIEVHRRNELLGPSHDKLVQVTPAADGSFNVSLDLSNELNGPLPLYFYGWDSPAGQGSSTDYQVKSRIIVFITGGKDYVKPTPPGAAGLELLFEDDFTAPLSISSTDPNATWFYEKPDGMSKDDFGDSIFWDENLVGGKNPFTQMKSFLRIRNEYTPNVIDPHSNWGPEGKGRKWTTGNISTGKPGGHGGFYASLPYYAELRFLWSPGGMTWPAFWATTLYSLQNQVNFNIETDIFECYGRFPDSFRSANINYNIPGLAQYSFSPLAQPAPFTGDPLCMQFHTIGIRVDVPKTTLYLDNVKVCDWDTPLLPNNIPRADQFMIDHAMGGGWPNTMLPYSSCYDMWIDDVRVYGKR